MIEMVGKSSLNEALDYRLFPRGGRLDWIGRHVEGLPIAAEGLLSVE